VTPPCVVSDVRSVNGEAEWRHPREGQGNRLLPLGLGWAGLGWLSVAGRQKWGELGQVAPTGGGVTRAPAEAWTVGPLFQKSVASE
jgi:hypothetical protein